MIIKLYAPDEKLFIIENARGVVVHGGLFVFNSVDELSDLAFGPDPKTSLEIFYTIQEPQTSDGRYCKFIDYHNGEGVRKRILVEHLAFVCSDEGKTIEKVDAEYRYSRPKDIASSKG